MKRWSVVLVCWLIGCSSQVDPAKDCSKDNGGCDPNATCVMVSGLPACECRPGFTGDGLKCADGAAPQLSIVAPLADQVFSSAGPATVEVSGAVSDAAAVVVTVSLDGASPEVAPVANGTFKVTLPLAEEDFTKHTVVVEAKDQSKNATTMTRTFVVDRVGPTLTVTSPASDAVCTDACTGAVVNLASGASLEFLGTAQDRGGLDVASMVATLDDESVELTKGADWSCGWSIPATSNGVFHSFKLVAADKAGNSSEVVRKVYVDRVAPCAKVLVAGARLVAPTTPLVEFTEPMEPRSATTALVLTPSPKSSPTLDSAGKTLAFRQAGNLLAYQAYALEVRSTAKDRAGNALGDGCRASSSQFLTAPVAPPEVLDVTNDLETLFITVDPDGNPQRVMGHWWDDESQTNFDTELWAWDGRGEYRKVRLWSDQDPYQWERVAAFGVRSVIGPDLVLNQVGHLFAWRFIPYTVTGSTSERYLEYSNLPSLNSVTGVSKLPYGTVDAGPFGGLGVWMVEPRVDLPPDAVVANLTDPKVLEKRQPGKGWAKVADWYRSSAPVRGFGGAGMASDKVVYLPNTVTLPWSIVDTSPSIPVYGVQQRLDQAGSKPVGAGWIAWAEHLKPSGQDYSALYLACSDEPSNGMSWKRSMDLTPIALVDRNAGITVSEIQMTTNDSLVGIAVKTSDLQVYTATLRNQCSLPGSLNWSTPVKNVRPVIALGPDGTVWKAIHK